MKVERWSDAQQPEIDAVDSVNRETDAGIVTPKQPCLTSLPLTGRLGS